MKRGPGFKDETGNVYTRLRVLEFDKYEKHQTYWKCLCDPELGGCGKIVSVQGRRLRNGETKSCGCLASELLSKRNRVDLTGQKFGRLEVIRLASIINGSAYWECLCDCGEIKTIRGSNLRSGDTKSCGCLYIEMVKSRFGKNHPNWNPDFTDEDRQDRRLVSGYKEWRKAVYELDDYTCQKCGESPSDNLNAHHIESYRSNPILRTEVSNGITLCEDCHKDFHHQYGYGDNTRAQLIEFLRSL